LEPQAEAATESDSKSFWEVRTGKLKVTVFPDILTGKWAQVSVVELEPVWLDPSTSPQCSSWVDPDGCGPHLHTNLIKYL
jgi:hypothetical protein